MGFAKHSLGERDVQSQPTDSRTFDTPSLREPWWATQRTQWASATGKAPQMSSPRRQQDHSLPLCSTGLDFLPRPASPRRWPLAQHPWILKGNQNFLTSCPSLSLRARQEGASLRKSQDLRHCAMLCYCGCGVGGELQGHIHEVTRAAVTE